MHLCWLRIIVLKKSLENYSLQQQLSNNWKNQVSESIKFPVKDEYCGCNDSTTKADVTATEKGTSKDFYWTVNNVEWDYSLA